VSDVTKGDWRDRRYSQTFRSEVSTLALCRNYADEENEIGNVCDIQSYARIRIIKQDTRLPMNVCVAFDIDAGNPDKAIISGRQVPTINAAELLLVRRSYVPVKQIVGNISQAGSIDFPARLGALGIALEFSSDCDAVEMFVKLVCAQGEKAPPTEARSRYATGRWIVGYSFTTNERLSIEEWTDACQLNAFTKRQP
jgi:hypothetical protein